jgi:hypothetical protein
MAEEYEAQMTDHEMRAKALECAVRYLYGTMASSEAFVLTVEEFYRYIQTGKFSEHPS